MSLSLAVFFPGFHNHVQCLGSTAPVMTQSSRWDIAPLHTKKACLPSCRKESYIPVNLSLIFLIKRTRALTKLQKLNGLSLI